LIESESANPSYGKEDGGKSEIERGGVYGKVITPYLLWDNCANRVVGRRGKKKRGKTWGASGGVGAPTGAN